jgi:hypothetical protein
MEQKVGFMHLPGEIRNIIYDLVLEDIELVSNIKLRRPKQSFASARSQTTESSGYFYIGFTNACRQVRAEFRVQYLRKVTFRVPFEDGPAFVATFHQHGGELGRMFVSISGFSCTRNPTFPQYLYWKI